MSVCQRKRGGWLCKYKDPQTGKWLQRQFKTRQLADEFDASAKIAAEKDRPLTLREALFAYVSNKDISKKHAATYNFLVNGGTNVVEGPAQHLADRYVHTLNRQDLESVRSKCRASNLKTTTMNSYIGCLFAALRWCAEEELIRENPWRKYRSHLPAQVAHRSGTLEELRAVYAELPPWLQWAVRTALALCLRPGVSELFALRWKAFDWRSGTVNVYMPKTKRCKLVFAPQWYLLEAWERFSVDADVDAFVCPSRKGRQIRQKVVYTRPWNAACRRANVKMPFYAVRHIAASEMLAAGADLAAVSAQLGHRSIMTTAQFYTHVLAKAQQGAASGIPELPPVTKMVEIGGSGNADGEAGRGFPR